MDMHDQMYGFEITNRRDCREAGGVLWEMRHVKTGAQLVWLDNGENNKLFSVAFKTLPWDDTGVFHILEHSVLCGSDHFPVKEPFLDLLKGSMNTFLNAMTFPDKTMYPVSSRNEQDFLNLTHVYLDAVFCPAIYHNPNIFRQEGWHYELREGDSAPTFKGVVFNEMKGAFSSVDEVLDNQINRMLYPDTCYSFVSGGDPERIPELTYERFLAAHREFYHPGNARIYLDGAVPLEKTLALIDSYLAQWEPSDQRHEIAVQQPVDAASATAYYEIGKDEDTAQKTQIALAKICGDWQDRKRLMALDALCSYLAGSNDAPLKRAVLSAGLAQDVRMDVQEEIAQPCFVLSFRNTEQENLPALKDIVAAVVSGLLEKGLDKEELAAAIDRMEFALTETEEPRAIMRAVYMLNSWLYGGDPMLYLTHGEVLSELRAALDTDYYEMLLREMLLDQAHTAQVVLLPSKTRGDELRRTEEKRLADAYASWTGAEKDEIMAQNAALDAWQQTPDSPEAVATLPVLSLSDVEETPEWTETRESEHAGARMLYHPVAAGGVVHGSLYFSLADQDMDTLQRLSFAVSLLSELPTDLHSVAELQKRVKQYTGRLRFGLAARAVAGNSALCRPQLTVSFSVLERKLPQALELIREILTQTRFDDANLLRELLMQKKEMMQQRVVMAGSRYALGRALAQYSADAAVEERTDGLSYYQWLKGFAERFDEECAAVQEFAGRIFRKVCTRGRLTVSETAAKPHAELRELAASFAPGKKAADTLRVAVSCTPVKTAVPIPAGVSYAVAASHLQSLGQRFSGPLMVMRQLLTYSYLWGEIRVQGGAYGCGFNARETGELAFHSYRDPNPMNSLQVYARTADFIRAFCKSDETVDKYIISSISESEPLLSPAEKGAAADAALFAGITYEDRLALRRELLALKKEDLLSLCGLFEKMAKDCAVCVLGSESALTETEGWQRETL